MDPHAQRPHEAASTADTAGELNLAEEQLMRAFQSELEAVDGISEAGKWVTIPEPTEAATTDTEEVEAEPVSMETAQPAVRLRTLVEKANPMAQAQPTESNESTQVLPAEKPAANLVAMEAKPNPIAETGTEVIEPITATMKAAETAPEAELTTEIARANVAESYADHATTQLAEAADSAPKPGALNAKETASTDQADAETEIIDEVEVGMMSRLGAKIADSKLAQNVRVDVMGRKMPIMASMRARFGVLGAYARTFTYEDPISEEDVFAHTKAGRSFLKVNALEDPQVRRFMAEHDREYQEEIQIIDANAIDYAQRYVQKYNGKELMGEVARKYAIYSQLLRTPHDMHPELPPAAEASDEPPEEPFEASQHAVAMAASHEITDDDTDLIMLPPQLRFENIGVKLPTSGRHAYDPDVHNPNAVLWSDLQHDYDGKTTNMNFRFDERGNYIPRHAKEDMADGIGVDDLLQAEPTQTMQPSVRIAELDTVPIPADEMAQYTRRRGPLLSDEGGFRYTPKPITRAA